MSSFLQDLRFAVRLLARTPGFTLAAVLVLALGVGVNTTVFSVARDLLFSPRPFPRPDEVVQLYSQDTTNAHRFRLFSYPAFREIRAAESAFADVLAHTVTIVGVGEGDVARRTIAAIVSSNYFSTLEVAPAQGRAFLPDEETPGSAAPVVIASHAYWKRTGFDPALVGKTIRINERPFTVVGITPERFTGTMMLLGPELYFPLGTLDLLANEFQSDRRPLAEPDAFKLHLVARLKPDSSLTAASAALESLAAGLRSTLPAACKDQTFIARPLPRLSTSSQPQGEQELQVLGSLLLGMAALVLLIACLNLANMLLARGAARKKEIAIRLALGGRRARIVRQLLTEGLVLAVAGGLGGLVLAAWGSAALSTSLGSRFPAPVFLGGAANHAVIAATLGFCAFATLVFALGPALKLARVDVVDDLKSNAGEDAIRRRRWLPRHPLVVAQIALSLGLLIAAGLFVRGAWEAGRAETGFDGDETLLVELDASLAGYDTTHAAASYRAAVDRLASAPGIEAVSLTGTVPFGLMTINRPVQRAGFHLSPEDRPASPAEGLACNARWNSVGADYFSALGLPLLRGRAFTKSEAGIAGSPAVAIVDEVLARQLWPDGDALGQRIQWADARTPRAPGGGSGAMGSSDDIARRDDDPDSVEIVGIAPTTRWDLFQKKTGGQIYVPFAQGFRSNAFLHIRLAGQQKARGPALAAASAQIRRELQAAAPGVPVFGIRTLREHIDSSLQLWSIRAMAGFFLLFGGLALVLAVVGVYGVKAYSVARRTREIGIRMAIGAAPGAVLGLVLREGLAMILSGAALGFLLALALGRAAAGMLYEVGPLDPYAFTLAPLALILAALLACWIPARRATRVNPITALRSE